MALNFDKLPSKKPGGDFAKATEGRHLAVVEKTEMTEAGYLRITFKLKEGTYVSENYFDSDKPFVQYKLSRLLSACKVQLEGVGSLEDVAKVVKGKKVIIDVVLNDRGYAGLDFSDTKEGIYARDEVVMAEAEPELESEIEEAIATEDDEF